MSGALDQRLTCEVGRTARLELTFVLRGGQTILAESYAEPPLRVGACLRDGDTGAHVIVGSSAPGIFGGDALDIRVDVGPGAQVRLASQSALQVHRSRTGQAARITTRYAIGEGAHVRAAWDPVIPFAGSVFDQRIEIALGSGASLLWSDAMMSGRGAAGERWRFDRFAHELRLLRSGRLAYLERYALEPADRLIARPWMAGDASYFGTVLRVGDFAGEDARSLHERLAAVTGVAAAVDQRDPDFQLVRLAGAAGAAFHAARQLASDEGWVSA